MSVNETVKSPHQTDTMSSKQMVPNAGRQDVIFGHGLCLQSTGF